MRRCDLGYFLFARQRGSARCVLIQAGSPAC
ncbi:MAG: TDP-N-acetylfucosamine:lipid II N-acetylfucosaminyltransferase [Escherichia sp.]